VNEVGVNSLEEYIGRNSLDFKTPALILGSAPSVKSVSKMQFSGIRIGVGDMPVRAKNLGPYDYWVGANSYYPLPWVSSDRDDIENSKAITLIASMSVIHSSASKEVIISALKEVVRLPNFILYNQKHFSGNECSSRNLCCEISEKFIAGPSIQELLGKMNYLESAAYGEGSTVALHGYALAVLLKANPIYIAGVELPIYYKDYRAYRNLFRRHEKIHSKIKRILKDNFFFSKNRMTDFGEAGREQILEDFCKILKIAKEMGITTYAIGVKSPLGQIPGMQTFINH